MEKQVVSLDLTFAEFMSLREKLGWLMTEANGVDIWLAPGTDVQAECFLDCDEEAHFHLGTILKKMGGKFQPHRTSGFKG